MQTGYLCRLKVTERTEVKVLLKKEIRRLTKLSKCDTLTRKFLKGKKGRLAKIYSKMEHLDMTSKER